MATTSEPTRPGQPLILTDDDGDRLELHRHPTIPDSLVVVTVQSDERSAMRLTLTQAAQVRDWFAANTKEGP